MFYSIQRAHSLCLAALFVCGFLSFPALAAGSRVKLAWDTNPEVRVAGYRIYRTEAGKSQILLNKDELLPEPYYVDTGAQKGVTYQYVVSAVDAQGQESPFSDEIKVTVELQPDSETFFPAGLTADQSLSDVHVGTSVLNMLPEPTPVHLSSLDGDGLAGGLNTDLNLNPFGGFRRMVRDLAPGLAAPATLVASGQRGAFEPVVTLVNDAITRLDGLTGTGESSRVLFLPIARQVASLYIYGGNLLETTVVSLSNPDFGQAAQVKLELFDQSGKVTHTAQAEIRPRASALKNLQQLFRVNGLHEGYLKVTSDIPIQGFELVGFARQSLASLWGTPGERSRALTLPYFFAGAGGDTQIRLINLEPFEVTARFSLHVDWDSETLKREFTIPANGLLVKTVGTLLGQPPELSKTGRLEVVTTTNNGAEEIYGRMVGVACYTANSQKAKAAVQLAPRPSLGYVLPALLQSAEQGYFTALSLVNAGPGANVVEMQAVDDQGNLLREHSLVLTPGGHVVDLLDGQEFFGSQFQQTTGHLRIRSTAPLFASAVIGNRQMDFLWGAGLIRTDGE